MDVMLLSDDENCLRYARGYIGMKLLKQLRKVKGAKAAQSENAYRACLGMEMTALFMPTPHNRLEL